MSNKVLAEKLKIESKKIISDIQALAVVNNYDKSAFLVALSALKYTVEKMLHPYTYDDFPPDYDGY